MSNNATCYYPNGDESQTTGGDIPCGSGDGVMCCPPDWECQDSGLCYNAGAGYLGRYTCTDQSWRSSECPQICTQGNSAAGNEAILECDSSQYCCDGDRVGPPCCDATNNRFFLLDGTKDERPFGGALPASYFDSYYDDTSSSIESPPSFSTSTTRASQTSRTTSTSFRASSSATTSARAVTTIVPQPGGGGSGSVITSIQTLQVTAAPTSTSSPAKPLGPIIGPAVAVPLLALILLSAILFFCLRRRKRRREAIQPGPGFPPSHGAEPMYRSEISPATGKSELEGSTPDLSAGSPTMRFDSPSAVGTVKDDRSSGLWSRMSLPRSGLRESFQASEDGTVHELPGDTGSPKRLSDLLEKSRKGT